MKAQELRIGNWVMTDTGSNYQIELSDFSDWYNDHNSHEYGKYVLPIPLTKEWLLKFGFEQGEKIAVHNRFVWYKDHIGIKGMLGVVKPVECKYVHQLQNLYYALTGEEL